MTAYPRDRDPLIPIEDLRSGMVFVDAAKPDRRVVILKVYYRSFEIWICTIPGRPRRRRTNDFYADPMTPHKKARRTGYYLDTTIPGNTREDWNRVARDGDGRIRRNA
jgi:hypothetical protein